MVLFGLPIMHGNVAASNNIRYERADEETKVFLQVFCYLGDYLFVYALKLFLLHCISPMYVVYIAIY